MDNIIIRLKFHNFLHGQKRSGSFVFERSFPLNEEIIKLIGLSIKTIVFNITKNKRVNYYLLNAQPSVDLNTREFIIEYATSDILPPEDLFEYGWVEVPELKYSGFFDSYSEAYSEAVEKDLTNE